MTVSHVFTHTYCKVDQACAIPFRRINGSLEFCLITSSSGRWIFPKGFIDAGCSLSETALTEAFEEAGLYGHIVGPPLGQYDTKKASRTFRVMASLMEVTKCLEQWPEENRRQRRWASREAAAKLLRQAELVDFLQAGIKRLGS